MPSPDLTALYTALRNADAAGDTAAATRLASYIKTLPAGRTPDAMDDPNAATVGMSVPEQALVGAGKWFADRARGIGQRLGLVTTQDVDEARQRDAPLMQPSETLPPVPGGKLGVHAAAQSPRSIASPAAVGNAAAGIVTMAPTAAIPGVNTVLGGAALGAVTGLTEPTGKNDSVLGNVVTSALTGGGANAAVRAVPAVVNAVTAPFYQAGRQRLVGGLLDRAGVSGVPAVASNTPGWQPTLAEAQQNPAVSIFQRGAESSDPTIGGAIAARRIQQNGSAVDALTNLAGSPEDQKLAIGMRDYMAGPLYKQAAKDGVDQGMAAALKPQIQNLMDRPSMKVAADRAKDIFGEESVNLARQGDVRGLQYLKQSLDDIIEKARSPASSIGKNQLRALQQTRSDLISTMGDLVPAQRAADTQYATFSRPINESAVATALKDKLVPALMDGNPNMTSRLKASSFADVIRNLDDQIPKLSGYPGATVENTMSPGAMKTLTGIRDDLANRARIDDAGIAGSKTSQNVASQNIIRSLLGPLGMPESWAGNLASSTFGRNVGRAGTWAYQVPEQEIQGEIAKALLDPNYAASLVAKAKSPMLGQKSRVAAALLQTLAAPSAIGVAQSNQ